MMTHGGALAFSYCAVLPFRHPSEVDQSSVTAGDRVALWANYMLAALTTARSVCGARDTITVHFEAWLHPELARPQLARLVRFLRCAVRTTGL